MPRKFVWQGVTVWESEPELATIMPTIETSDEMLERSIAIDYAHMSIADLLFWAGLWIDYAKVNGLDQQQRADVKLIWQLIWQRISEQEGATDVDAV